MADLELIVALDESAHYQHLKTLVEGQSGFVVKACRRTADSTQGVGETLAIKLLPRAQVSEGLQLLQLQQFYACRVNQNACWSALLPGALCNVVMPVQRACHAVPWAADACAYYLLHVLDNDTQDDVRTAASPAAWPARSQHHLHDVLLSARVRLNHVYKAVHCGLAVQNHPSSQIPTSSQQRCSQVSLP